MSLESFPRASGDYSQQDGDRILSEYRMKNQFSSNRLDHIEQKTMRSAI